VSSEEDNEVTIFFSKEALQIFHQLICKTYSNWPGGNPQEQIMLEKLKHETFKLLLDLQYDET